MIVKCSYYSDFSYPKIQVLDFVWQIYKTRTHILKYLSLNSEKLKKNQSFIHSILFQKAEESCKNQSVRTDCNFTSISFVVFDVGSVFLLMVMFILFKFCWGGGGGRFRILSFLHLELFPVDISWELLLDFSGYYSPVLIDSAKPPSVFHVEFHTSLIPIVLEEKLTLVPPIYFSSSCDIQTFQTFMFLKIATSVQLQKLACASKFWDEK